MTSYESTEINYTKKPSNYKFNEITTFTNSPVYNTIPRCYNLDGSIMYLIYNNYIYKSLNNSTPTLLNNTQYPLGINTVTGNLPFLIQCSTSGKYLEFISSTGASYVSTDYGSTINLSSSTTLPANHLIYELQISTNNINISNNIPVYRCFITTDSTGATESRFYLSTNGGEYIYDTRLPLIKSVIYRYGRCLNMSDSGKYITYVYARGTPGGGGADRFSFVDFSKDYGASFTTIWNGSTSAVNDFFNTIDSSTDGKYQLISSSYQNSIGGGVFKITINNADVVSFSLSNCPLLSFPRYTMVSGTGQYQFVLESYPTSVAALLMSSDYGNSWYTIFNTTNPNNISNAVISKSGNFYTVYYAGNYGLYYAYYLSGITITSTNTTDSTISDIAIMDDDGLRMGTSKYLFGSGTSFGYNSMLNGYYPVGTVLEYREAVGSSFTSGTTFNYTTVLQQLTIGVWLVYGNLYLERGSGTFSTNSYVRIEITNGISGIQQYPKTPNNGQTIPIASGTTVNPIYCSFGGTLVCTIDNSRPNINGTIVMTVNASTKILQVCFTKIA